MSTSVNQPSIDKLSYVRAVREVIPSDSLRDFLHMAHEFAQDETFEVGHDMGDLLIYAGTSLRVTMYERRARAGRQVNKHLKELYNRMESPTITVTRRARNSDGVLKTSKKQEPNLLLAALSEAEMKHNGGGAPLVLRATKIVDSTKFYYRHLGTELALVLNDGPAAAVLEDQRELMMAAANGISVTRLLPRSDDPDPVRYLPFMRAPFATAYHRDAFIDLMTSELPVHDIELGPIDWTLKNRPAPITVQ